MDFQELSSTKEFTNLHPVKQKIIKELISSGQNKSPEMMLPKIMTINKELSKRNLSFTKDELGLLIRIMKDDMSPAEQQKIDMLINLFNR